MRKNSKTAIAFNTRSAVAMLAVAGLFVGLLPSQASAATERCYNPTGYYSTLTTNGVTWGSHRAAIRLCVQDSEFTEAVTRYNYFDKSPTAILFHVGEEEEGKRTGSSNTWIKAEVEVRYGIPKTPISVNRTHFFEWDCQTRSPFNVVQYSCSVGGSGWPLT